jgi:hypothetical protein
MYTDRQLSVLGRQSADAAMTKGNVEQVRRLSDLAYQAYFGGSGPFNTVTMSFINLLKQLGTRIPENLEHYQLVRLYAAAQNAIRDYREEARNYEALKAIADRVKHGELSGRYSPERLEYTESPLSKQARRLVN